MIALNFIFVVTFMENKHFCIRNQDEETGATVTSVKLIPNTQTEKNGEELSLALHHFKAKQIKLNIIGANFDTINFKLFVTSKELCIEPTRGFGKTICRYNITSPDDNSSFITKLRSCFSNPTPVIPDVSFDPVNFEDCKFK